MEEFLKKQLLKEPGEQHCLCEQCTPCTAPLSVSAHGEKVLWGQTQLWSEKARLPACNLSAAGALLS